MYRNRILCGLIAIGLSLGLSGFAAAGGKNAAKTGTPRPMQKLHEILNKLDLSADQTKQLSDVLSSAEDQMRTLHAEAKSSGDRGATHEKMKSIMTSIKPKIEAVLTPQQRQTFEQEISQMREQRRGGPATQPATA